MQTLVCLSDPLSEYPPRALLRVGLGRNRSKHRSACLHSAEIRAMDSRLQSKRMACVHSTKRRRRFPDVSVRLEVLELHL